MKEDISTVEYASLLYDFYGDLLNDKQSNVMGLYHEDNLSLSEIADDLGMTRQAVHYTLKKAEGSLEKYEEKLKLISKYLNNEAEINSALKKLDEIEEEGLSADNMKRFADIKKILERLED